MDTSVITNGLNIDRTVVDRAFKGVYNPKMVEATARSLASNLSNPDNTLAAGRMLLYNAARSCGRIQFYVKINSRRLNTSTANFLLKHNEILDKELASRASVSFENHDFFSAATMIRMYLLKPTYGEKPWETVQQQCLRIATELWSEKGTERVVECYRDLSDRFYTPASPTIFNAGTKAAQMASCFLLSVADDLESILYTGVGDAGMISKDNGGLGINANNLRHSKIGHVGMSPGIMPALRVYDRSVKYVNQGGTRDGACTAFLRTEHIDIAEFIKSTDIQDHTQRLATLNTCIWGSDLFYDAVENEETEFMAFCPAKAGDLKDLYGQDLEDRYEELKIEAKKRDAEYIAAAKRVSELEDKRYIDPEDEKIEMELLDAMEAKMVADKARIEHKIYDPVQLYEDICNIQIKSGMPYIMYCNPINAKSNQKNKGVINSSNLCVEITEVSSPDEIASCNLSSMNMSKFTRGTVEVKDSTDAKFLSQLRQAYDFELWGKKIQNVVQNLNRVIDKNHYPLDKKNPDGSISQGKISKLNFEMRPLGIGVSGYADAAYQMDLAYDDSRTGEWNKIVFACAYFHGMVASMRLAIEEGEYKYFRTGEYKQYAGHKTVMKNGKEVRRAVFKTVKGSPLSNGQFQFDLWAEEAQMLSDLGRLDEDVYDRKADIPVDPLVWDQKPILISVLDKDGNKVEFTIEPSWDSLRKWIMKYGVRNSLLFALMPTASTAHTLRNNESTEAPQTNYYARSVLAGNFVVCNRHLVKDMSELKCWDENMIQLLTCDKGSVRWIIEFIKDHPQHYPAAFEEKGQMKPEVEARLQWLVKKYMTMYEVSQKIPLTYAAERGRYICQSQSTNIYKMNPTPEMLQAIHSFTRKLRLKTGMYYLRQDPAKDQGKFNIDANMLKYYNALQARMDPNAMMERLNKPAVLKPTPSFTSALMKVAEVTGVTMPIPTEKPATPPGASPRSLTMPLTEPESGGELCTMQKGCVMCS